ncbi:MAG: LD-carboxypeptidase [Bacteroidota bacterium]|nr:LD-carboxypeptidase [Bacteroidota bacterium]
MIIPDYLKEGDSIGLISTARKISLNELNSAVRVLKNWGLKVVLGKHIFSQYRQFAGTDLERKTDFEHMLKNSKIKAILCVRGGYGTVRIIDKLEDTLFTSSPKWIIGYSDVTVIHSHLYNLGIASIHAPMAIDFLTASKQSLDTLRFLLFGQQNCIKTKSNKLNREGEIKGEIIGGNLSILYSLLGSTTDINTSNKILFIEDLDEYLYHIDRMIINMKRNQKFKKIKGLIVGGMNNMNDNKIKFGKTAREIIFEHIAEYNFPVCFGFPSGHIKNHMSICFGKESLLKITSKSVVLHQ